MSVVNGDTQTDDFLALNPNGKIPAVVLPNNQVLTESNAILNFFAHDTPYLPANSLDRARVLEWQFFEQYSHEPTIAVARFIKRYLGNPANKQNELAEKQNGGRKALAVMESRLAKNTFIAGSHYTIADMSLYAYTHVAEEAGIDLEAYQHIKNWLRLVESQEGHQTMDFLANALNSSRDYE